MAIRLLPAVRVWSSSLNVTRDRFLLGTSTPMACFPGMGATMRTLEAASLSATLSCRFVIFDSLMPGGGRSSNIVTTGPFLIPVISTRMLNSENVSSSRSARFLVSSSIPSYVSSEYWSSKSYGTW